MAFEMYDESNKDLAERFLIVIATPTS